MKQFGKDLDEADLSMSGSLQFSSMLNLSCKFFPFKIILKFSFLAPMILQSRRTVSNLSQINNENNPLQQLHYSIIHGISQANSPQKGQGEFILPLVCQVKVLYGKDRALKAGKEEDMERLNMLQKVVGMSYKELSNLSYFGSVGFESEGDKQFVIFTGEFVFYCNETKKKLVWHIKARAIKECKNEEKNVSIGCLTEDVREVFIYRGH